MTNHFCTQPRKPAEMDQQNDCQCQDLQVESTQLVTEKKLENPLRTARMYDATRSKPSGCLKLSQAENISKTQKQAHCKNFKYES